jgi:hypothetical protein
MAATGYTPIQLYYSTTASATPSSGNLLSGELALNIQDEKLYFKNASGTVKLLASSAAATGLTIGTSTITGGTNGYFLYNNAGVLGNLSTIPTTGGGTGLTSYTTGDIIYASATNTLSKLAVGTNGYILTLSGGVPTWAANTGGVTSFQTSLSGLTPSSSTTGAITLAGTLGATSGGTGLTSYTTGDIIYASATNTLSKLAAGTNGYILSLSGGVPTWTANAGSTTLTTTTFTATSGQTSFSVTYTPALLQGVYRNGIKLDPSDYTATSGTAIVLSTGAITGDNIQVQYFSSLSTVTAVNSITFGTTGLTPNSATSGAVTVAGTLNITNGGTGATTAAAANANLQGFTTTATAAGTTALTNTSTYYQYFTGTTTQTITLPLNSTIQNGWSFHIANNSTGNLTVNSNSGALVCTIIPQVTAHVTCVDATVNTASAWDSGFTDFGSITGTGANVLATSPTLVTPVLGTPTSVTLTNATGLPLTTGVTGTLPVTNGGTGVASATAYSLLAGGTTSTGAFQSLASLGTSGQILTSNGAGALPTWQNAAGGGGLGGITVFTSSGTFTIPTGKTVVKVTVQGGGGGSGATRNGAASGGGGGGGTAITYLTGLTPGNTLTVTVGLGGIAGATTGGNPQNAGTGGTSSVASGTQTITTVSATGGAGTLKGDNGSYSSGGSGGGTSGGTFGMTGNVGTANTTGLSTGSCPNYYTFTGMGGSSMFGSAGNPSVVGTPTTSGNTPSSYGSGATGSATNGGSSIAGSAGAPGIVIIEY